jgi:cell shape-determining protein MreC
MKPSTFLIALVVLSLAVLTVFFGQEAFSAARDKTEIFLANLSKDFNYQECRSLVRENEQLKFELSKYVGGPEEETGGNLTAEVFSRYPFNNKERLIVNLGGREGIEAGFPVLSHDGYLVGVVSAVRKNQSEVQTIFDPEWKSSVAAGNASTKAVMKGGNIPELELIPKESEIKEGDFVFNISPDFPYGKLIGKVRSMDEDPEKTWYTASVEVPYDIDEVTEVVILAGFKE